MPVSVVAFAAALLVASLTEYWGHRFMHAWLLKKKHAAHHKEGTGQGWLGEFYDYVLGSIPLLLLPFLFGMSIGGWFLAGGLTYAAFAAYSHQLQHEKPELCFWLPRPVHRIHHEQHMWRHNFGISIDLWDRVFGTYRKVEWTPSPTPRRWREMFTIKWI